MIEPIQVNKPQIGVTFTTTGQAEVNVWSPLANHISIHLPDSGKKLPLKKADLGYWHLTTDQLRPGDLYEFVIDGEKNRPDPASRSQPKDVHDPSQAIDLNAFNWEDADWQNVPLDEYLIYELHVGTFTPEGTFAAIEGKLDYLLELGVNAIEIMPVAEFSDSHNWGYDSVLPYAVLKAYGGPLGLQHLINACHQKGIAVVLDVVYNHLGAEGNYLPDYAPYFTSKYCTPWGNAVNFDGAWSDGVRRYFVENVLMWFRDFHADALRLDAVHALVDLGPTHILQEIRQHVDQLMAKTGKRHYLLAECDLNDPKFINPLDEHGYGMDAQWCDEFHHALRVTVGEERNGYYSDFNGIAQLAKSYRDAYVYDGDFSQHRKKLFGAKAENNPGQQFIIFSQNHDQIGNRMLGERTSQLFSFETVKLLAGSIMVSPYLPLLFMGEEWGETNPFLFFARFMDEDLGEKVRQGRKQEFAAFQTEGEVPDPLSEDTFQRSKLQWHLLEQEPHKTMFSYYKTLIALRKQHPVLRSRNRHQLEATCQEEQNLLLLHRWEADHHLLCLLNFSSEQQPIPLPNQGHQWKKVLDSADPQWRGPGTTAPETTADAETIIVQPQSMVIYSHD